MKTHKIVRKLLGFLVAIILFLGMIGNINNTHAYDCSQGNHDYEITVIPATSASNGEKRYRCTLCGHYYVVVIYPSEHSWSPWMIEQSATCTHSGIRYRICTSHVQHTEKQIIPATGHHYHEEIVTVPTCKELGIKRFTCEDCGHFYTTTYGTYAEHQLHEIDYHEATVEEEGKRILECLICGEQVEEILPRLDHEHVYKVLEIAPTCEEDGRHIYECEECDKHYEEIIPALGHKMGEWEVYKHENLTEEGLRVRFCMHNCGYKEEEVIPRGITLEIQSVDVALATVNISWVVVFIVSIMSDLYVLRWESNLRKQNIMWYEAKLHKRRR